MAMEIVIARVLVALWRIAVKSEIWKTSTATAPRDSHRLEGGVRHLSTTTLHSSQYFGNVHAHTRYLVLVLVLQSRYRSTWWRWVARGKDRAVTTVGVLF